MQEKLKQKVQRAMLCMARQCWEQGLAAQAMLESGETDLMLLFARDCVVRQHADGRLCDVEGTPATVDPAICVESVLRAGEILKDDRYTKAGQRNIDYLLNAAPRTVDGACYQLYGNCEVWADSLGMGPHVLLLGGHVKEGFALYEAIKRRLYDQATGLFRHKWDEAAQCFARPCFWAIGNGWAMTGLMRMAQILKRNDHPYLQRAIDEFKALYEAVLPYQHENGAFCDILDDSTSFLETEFTEMFAYSVASMVKLEALPKEALEHAFAARKYVIEQIDDYGVVQGCAGSPTFEKKGASTEAQAHFLMMEKAFEALDIG